MQAKANTKRIKTKKSGKVRNTVQRPVNPSDKVALWQQHGLIEDGLTAQAWQRYAEGRGNPHSGFPRKGPGTASPEE